MNRQEGDLNLVFKNNRKIQALLDFIISLIDLSGLGVTKFRDTGIVTKILTLFKQYKATITLR